jgi:hypothetical protein
MSKSFEEIFEETNSIPVVKEDYAKGYADGKQKAKTYIIGALERAYPSTIWARTEHVIKLIEDLDV